MSEKVVTRKSIESQTAVVGFSDSMNVLRRTSKRVEPEAGMKLAVTIQTLAEHLAERCVKQMDAEGASTITPSMFNKALYEMRAKNVLPVVQTAPEGDTERQRNLDHTKMLVDRRVKQEKKKAVSGEDASVANSVKKAKKAKEDAKKKAEAEGESEPKAKAAGKKRPRKVEPADEESVREVAVEEEEVEAAPKEKRRRRKQVEEVEQVEDAGEQGEE